MSHFSVLVNLGPIPIFDVQSRLNEVMQPYHEFECTGVDDQYVIDTDFTDEVRTNYERYKNGRSFDDYVSEDYGNQEPYFKIERNNEGEVTKVIRRTNPNSKWDYFVIGGRWSDFLYLGDCRWGNYAKKKDIDFVGANNISTVKMTNRYNDIRDKLGSHTDNFRTWEKILEECGGNVNQARDVFSEQPAVQMLRREGIFVDIEDYLLPLDKFLKKKVPLNFVTFAFILKNGEWCQKGEMGWWGSVSEEKETEEWGGAFQDFISNSDDDDVLVVVDCHI